MPGEIFTMKSLISFIPMPRLYGAASARLLATCKFTFRIFSVRGLTLPPLRCDPRFPSSSCHVHILGEEML
jgi:hypothetical protein